MTHALHDYLAGQLGEWLSKRSIVVFYDPREEFRPFFDDLAGAESSGESPIRVTLAEAEVSLARYRGSFFELRAAVEPIARWAAVGFCAVWARMILPEVSSRKS